MNRMQFSYTRLSRFFVFNLLFTFVAVSGQDCLTEYSRCNLAAANRATDENGVCGPTGTIRECANILRQSCTQEPYKMYGEAIADYFDYLCTSEFGNDVLELYQCSAHSTCSNRYLEALGEGSNPCRVQDTYEDCLRVGGCGSNALRYATKTGAIIRIGCGDFGGAASSVKAEFLVPQNYGLPMAAQDIGGTRKGLKKKRREGTLVVLPVMLLGVLIGRAIQ